MDLSALIFVALAVAWAVYLVPKALKHHDEVQRSRSVERFSHTMRVLARREPVNRRDARLVLAPHRAASSPTVETKPSAARPSVPVAPVVRRAAAARAARRRRRVLSALALANVVVLALAIGEVVAWPWVAAPASLLVAWLVTCRLAVRRERSARPSAVVPAPVEKVAAEPSAGEPSAGEPSVGEWAADEPVWHEEQVDEPAAEALAPAPGSWDMVPMTLPTYVDKAHAARRTVQTIDLDSTGVWSSGRSDVDSALARESEQVARSAREQAREQARARRVSGA